MTETLLAKLKEIDSQLTEIYRSHGLSEHIDDWFFHFPWPAWLKSVDGRMLAMNPSYTKRYGVTVGDYLDHQDKSVWSSETQEMFHSNDAEVARTGNPGVYSERILNAKTKEEENLLVCKFPVFQGGELIGVGGFCIYIPT